MGKHCAEGRSENQEYGSGDAMDGANGGSKSPAGIKQVEDFVSLFMFAFHESHYSGLEGECHLLRLRCDSLLSSLASPIQWNGPP